MYDYKESKIKMKKTQLLSLFLFLLFAITACAAPQSTATITSNQPPVDTTPAVMMEKTVETTTSPRYVEYSKTVLEQSVGMRRVLFFYASWCSTCRPADADFKKNIDLIPADLVLIRVNYNDPETDAEEKALAGQYGITYQHTFVQIDAQGNVLTEWNGGQFNELIAKVKSS